VHFIKLLSKVASREGAIQGETLHQFNYILNVEALGVSLKVVLPVVNSILGPLVRSIIAIHAAHGVSRGHFNTRYLSINVFEAFEESGIVNITLGHVIEKITNISQRELESALIFDVINKLLLSNLIFDNLPVKCHH